MKTLTTIKTGLSAGYPGFAGIILAASLKASAIPGIISLSLPYTVLTGTLTLILAGSALLLRKLTEGAENGVHRPLNGFCIAVLIFLAVTLLLVLAAYQSVILLRAWLYPVWMGSGLTFLLEAYRSRIWRMGKPEEKTDDTLPEDVKPELHLAEIGG